MNPGREMSGTVELLVDAERPLAEDHLSSIERGVDDLIGLHEITVLADSTVTVFSCIISASNFLTKRYVSLQPSAHPVF